MEGAQPPLAAGKTPGPLFAFLPPNPPGALARGHRVPRPAQSRLGTSLAHFPLSFPNAAAEELTTPGLKKAHTPPLHEDANTAVIAGRGSVPRPPRRPGSSSGQAARG